MRKIGKGKDEFACINETKKKGNMLVFALAVLAICISGALCARKLQMEEKYITNDLAMHYLYFIVVQIII